MRSQERDFGVVLPSELWISESVKERYARLLDTVACFYFGAHETGIADSSFARPASIALPDNKAIHRIYAALHISEVGIYYTKFYEFWMTYVSCYYILD